MDSLLILTALVSIALLALGYFLVVNNSSDKAMPYRAKKYFFSREEQEFLRLLNESIDRQKYTIFPKVSLSDFVEVTVKGRESQSWWNRVKFASVDFLVWDVLESKIVLGIEFDDRSHQSEAAIASDSFEDRLYEKIGVPLMRVDVGSSFVEQVAQVTQRLSTEQVTA